MSLHTFVTAAERIRILFLSEFRAIMLNGCPTKEQVATNGHRQWLTVSVLHNSLHWIASPESWHDVSLVNSAVAQHLITYFTVRLWALRRDMFFMTLISHCDCIHCYAGNWVLHPVQLLFSWNHLKTVCFKTCHSRVLCFHRCHFLPSWDLYSDLSIWENDAVKDKIQTCYPLTVTHSPVLQ